ncbi:hypothetical protein CLF_101310, partial [Clonorchis sinensis]
ELLVLGYPAVMCFENEQPVIIVDQLVHGMARLLNSYLKNLSQQNELTTKLRSAEADLTQVQKMYRRCQEDLNESHKAIALARERDRRADEEKRAIQLRLRAATDEVRKLQLNFQRYETQSAHERRKLENELVAMRERLSTTIVPRPGNVANNIPRRSSKGRSRTSVQISSVVTLDSLSDTIETAAGLAPTFNSRPSTRVVAKPTRTLSSLGAQNPGQKSEWYPQDTTVAAVTQKPSQMALYTHLIQSLQEREHTLLYENRELRDLVSQISSRLVRFSHFVDQQRRSLSADKDPVSNALSTTDDEFDSLDEEDDDTVSQSVQRESSDDEFPNRYATPSHSSGSRRKSSNVNQLLLQLPYPLVRERLTQRVRQLSKELWRRLKQLSVTPDTKETVTDLTQLNRLGEFSRGDSTNTPRASEKPVASARLLNNTRIADANQPQSDAENQDPEKMSNEIKTLKELVREYEGRMQKQEVALRKRTKRALVPVRYSRVNCMAISAGFFACVRHTCLPVFFIILAPAWSYIIIIKDINISVDTDASLHGNNLVAKLERERLGTAAIPYKPGTSEIIRRILNTANIRVAFQRGNTALCTGAIEGSHPDKQNQGLSIKLSVTTTLRQLNVLHQVASFFSCYDIRDITFAYSHHKGHKFATDTFDRQTPPKLLMINRLKSSFPIETNGQVRASEKVTLFRNLPECKYVGHVSSARCGCQTVHQDHATFVEECGVLTIAVKRPIALKD